MVKAETSGELVFAVVGHIGSGTSTIARRLVAVLEGEKYHVSYIKASDCIREWAKSQDKAVDGHASRSRARLRAMQDLGDEIRVRDHGAVARQLVRAIKSERAQRLGQGSAKGPVHPDGKRHAYVLDSVRHPAEVHLLRAVYGNAFALIGVVCDEQVRRQRIVRKYEDIGEPAVDEIMEYDARAGAKHSQSVRDAFFLSDVFLDNTVESERADEQQRRKVPNEAWDIPDQLRRTVNIVARTEVVRPTIEEHAMFVAYGAQQRSACLSRQVGAAVVDRGGNVLASGTNEVPQAGGGVYGQTLVSSARDDHRCANRPGSWQGCWNTKKQSEIIDDLIDHLPTEAKLPPNAVAELKNLSPETQAALRLIFTDAKDDLREQIRKTRVGSLLEFSRAVHAEMDALLSVARQGISTLGTRIFVTTFPCHYCARHIVGAGVDEVQFIEPYPKSLALDLHSDSITTNRQGWVRPSESKGGSKQVLFRPFTGVAPRLYERAFLKDRPLKDDRTGEKRLGEAEWTDGWDIFRKSYVELEAQLAEEEVAET
ncbi:anti-phage dCTP deaminase [Nannocystis pusilla]|uniref:Cytidine deaminase n=1 Tax=Nannocystis pusilla TaxID=889268 RepID=A0ABS7TPF2_9BACT|nr:cytidine deaminase [Nannocystis pusilla]